MFCGVLHILCAHVAFSRGSSPLPVVSQAHMKTSHHLSYHIHRSKSLLLEGIFTLSLLNKWFFKADAELLNISYGIIFWCNSHLSDSIFKIQKRIIRVITNSGRHDLCRDFYKKLQILPLPSHYIFSLLVFVNKNRSCFISNSEVHDINPFSGMPGNVPGL